MLLCFDGYSATNLSTWSTLNKLFGVEKSKMDTAGSLFAGLTLASIVTNGGLTINLTENFGTLWNDGDVKHEAGGGDKLVGTYANAVTGVSAVVIGLSALYLVFFIYGWYKRRNATDANPWN